MSLPHDPGPHWGEVGIHGLHRQREWDALATVDAPEIEGDAAWFVALGDSRLVVEEGAGEVDRLAGVVSIAPPYRAHAVRRDGGLWVVAARRIDTVELRDDPGGDNVELSWDGVERAVRIDGRPTLTRVAELEELAAGHARYVVTAARIAGSVWEVLVAPL